MLLTINAISKIITVSKPCILNTTEIRMYKYTFENIDGPTVTTADAR